MSSIMEARLVIFTDNSVLQMILCGENEKIIEVPGETLVEGLLHLTAAYYVFGVEYPKCAEHCYTFFGTF